MAGLPSPHLRAKSPFPMLWTGFLLMALLTVVALGLAIGQWERPIAGVLVDPFGLVDNYGWPSWSGYQQGLAYPDRVIAANDHRLNPDAAAVDLDRIAAQAQAAATTSAPAPIRLLIEQGDSYRVVPVTVGRVGLPTWLLLCGGYLLLAWVWLSAAGILYTARPQSRAVGSFVRWVLVAAVLLITLFDFHTTRRLVPLTLIAYACLPSALIEIGLCFPERIAILSARPRLLWILRALDVALAGVLIYGYLHRHSFRSIVDVGTAIAIVSLTVILALRCTQAQGRRRVQLLVALLLLMPLYLVLGGMLLWTPDRSAPYLYVLVLPITVFGALGMAYALLRYDIWDSRTLLRKPGLRPLVTAVLAFVVSLLGAIGFVGIRAFSDAVQVLYVVVLVGATGSLVRRAAEWVDLKLFPADVRYQATVEQLSLRFTDLTTTAAVAEVVEQAVSRAVDCARARLLPVAAPVWTSGNDSQNLGRFLPKVAQVMAAAIANQPSDTPESAVGTGEGPSGRAGARSTSASDLPLAAPSASSAPDGAAAAASASSGIMRTPSQRQPPRLDARNLKPLRQAIKSAGLFTLTAEQEQALAQGELVYLAPVRQLSYSVQALWSWLLIAVRFRDHIIGLIAVAPKSVAQVFTPSTESLLRTIGNQAALALYCAGLSEQLEARRRTQESLLHAQADLAVATLAREVVDGLDDASPLLRPLRALSQPRSFSPQPQRLRPLIEQARLLLHDRLRARLLEIDLMPALEIDCDADSTALLLSNLLAIALHDCPPPGRVGISGNIESDQRLRISIWDMGPPATTGAPDAPQPRRLLDTASADSSAGPAAAATQGLALHHALAQQLARVHGWELSFARRADRKNADIVIPATAWRRKRPADGSGGPDEDPSATDLE